MIINYNKVVITEWTAAAQQPTGVGRISCCAAAGVWAACRRARSGAAWRPSPPSPACAWLWWWPRWGGASPSTARPAASQGSEVSQSHSSSGSFHTHKLTLLLPPDWSGWLWYHMRKTIEFRYDFYYQWLLNFCQGPVGIAASHIKYNITYWKISIVVVQQYIFKC